VSASQTEDGIIYEAEAVRIGVLLFGARTCSGCGCLLPANSDYYVRDVHRPGGLTSDCRRCRRTRQRAYHQRKVAS
jgi:hypothetical protein